MATIREHYVPQFILKRFTADKKNIYVYDKSVLSSHRELVKDVAQEHYFYDLPQDAIPPGHPDPPTDLQAFEKGFSRLEDALSKIHEALINKSLGDAISADERSAMAYGIAVQRLRTRAFRDNIADGTKQIYEAAIDEIMRQNFPDDLDLTPKIKVSDRSAAFRQLLMIFDPSGGHVKGVARLIDKCIWTLELNDTQSELYISDNPIVTQIPQQGASTEVPIDAPGVEIIFPISPKHALVLRDRDTFKAFEHLDNKVAALEAQNVDRYNELQVRQSVKQIFSLSDDFTLADSILRATS